MNIDAYKAKFTNKTKYLPKAPELVGPPDLWDLYCDFSRMLDERPALDQFRFRQLTPGMRLRLLVHYHDRAMSHEARTQERREAEQAEIQRLREQAHAEAQLEQLQDQLAQAALGDRLGAW
jgi:hypothetical protein